MPGREDLITLGNAKTEWGSWSYSRTGWVWPETFCNEVYVGDDQVGFSLMTEGARNIVGPKYADFLRRADGRTTAMTIHLVSQPTVVREPLAYTFFYQTMPLRPPPQDPKRWHVGYDPSTVHSDTTPVPCSNALHGCGYLAADGTRQPTLNLLATRNFVKRMYTLLKADGKDRINFNHTGEGGAIGAFADVRAHGEEICWEGKDHCRRLTPDFVRARYAQNDTVRHTPSGRTRPPK